MTSDKLRSYRVFGISVFDTVLTLLGALVIVSLRINPFSLRGLYLTLVIFGMLVLLAIGVHYALGIPTQLNRYLGLSK